MNTTFLLVGGAVLALGTFAMRLAGPALRSRVAVPERVEKLLATGAVVLLVAVMTTSALTQGHGFAGFARPAGVAVGGLLAWRRAPFIVVVLAAAATTAALRLLKGVG